MQIIYCHTQWYNLVHIYLVLLELGGYNIDEGRINAIIFFE